MNRILKPSILAIVFTLFLYSPATAQQQPQQQDQGDLPPVGALSEKAPDAAMSPGAPANEPADATNTPPAQEPNTSGYQPGEFRSYPTPAVTPAEETMTNSPGDQQGEKMDAGELEKLVAPIALYPDPLLAQVLAASGYPLDIVQADRWVKQNPDLAKNQAEIDKQSWDASVKALANYPEVLSMMAEKLTWTQQLGDAVRNQEQDVMEAVQRDREIAKQRGTLESNAQQRVEEQGSNIVIVPANPQYIQVPQYYPQDVYGEDFGYYDYYPYHLSAPYAFGYDYGFRYSRPYGYSPYLDLDFDWDRGCLYYGGYGFRHGFIDDKKFHHRHRDRFKHDRSDSFHRYSDNHRWRDHRASSRYDRYHDRGDGKRSAFGIGRADAAHFSRKFDSFPAGSRIHDSNLRRSDPGFRSDLSGGRLGSSVIPRSPNYYSGTRFAGQKPLARSQSRDSRLYRSQSGLRSYDGSLGFGRGTWGRSGAVGDVRSGYGFRGKSDDGLRGRQFSGRRGAPEFGMRSGQFNRGGSQYGIRSGGYGGLRNQQFGVRSGGGYRGPQLGTQSGGGYRGQQFGIRSGGGYRGPQLGTQSGGGYRGQQFGIRSGGGYRGPQLGTQSGFSGYRGQQMGVRSGAGFRGGDRGAVMRSGGGSGFRSGAAVMRGGGGGMRGGGHGGSRR